MSEQERKDGGQAFPNPGRDYAHHVNDGMTLRDYFAGQALDLSASHWEDYEGEADIAAGAYIIADAMLAEREGPQ